MKKTVVITNIICVICWIICSVINFVDGNTPLAVFQIVLAVAWAIMAAINFKNLKK